MFCSANLEYGRRTLIAFNQGKDSNRMTILVAWQRKDLKRLGCEYQRSIGAAGLLILVSSLEKQKFPLHFLLGGQVKLSNTEKEVAARILGTLWPLGTVFPVPDVRKWPMGYPTNLSPRMLIPSLEGKSWLTKRSLISRLCHQSV